MGAHEVLHLLLGHGLAFLQDHARHDLLAVLLVGDADHLHVGDFRVRVDELLDLLRVDVLAAADDHVLQPAGDAVVALGRPKREVAGVKPAVGVDSLSRLFGHFVVPFHDVVAAGDELADLVVAQLFAGFRIDDFVLAFRQVSADACNAVFNRVGRR